MPNFGPPPDHIQDAFRDHLIRHGGATGLARLGYTEEVNRFKFYLDTLENFISQQESDEIVALEADAAHLTDDARDEFWSWYYPVHWDEIFRTNLRSSFLVSLVSMIESQLSEVCRDVEVIARTPIQAGDLKGSLLERTHLFLEKFGAFQQPTAEVWAKFSRIYDIRNVFVHHAGFLPAYNHENRTRQFIEGGKMITETNGTLTIKREFCVDALRVAQELLDAIAGELSALCSRVQMFEGLPKQV